MTNILKQLLTNASESFGKTGDSNLIAGGNSEKRFN